MKQLRYLRHLLVSSIFFASFTTTTQAQIIPDSTLINNSHVTQSGKILEITGGTIPAGGGNLFHSFSAFSLPTGYTAYFNKPLSIQNIFARVTGSSISNIDGLLRANGTASLFLLNPNGIIFGSNAELNIRGSFMATTASYLNFADGTQFSATASQTKPLLTVSVPIGLQFGTNPGRIINRSIATAKDNDGNQILDTNGNPITVGLQIDRGKTLALIGGKVELQGGDLTAPQGRIELGSVADSSSVSLNPTAFGWTLGYSGVHNFQDIQLSQGSVVDASGEGGGNIFIQGADVTVTDNSFIQALTNGSQNGGEIFIRAEQLNINGFSLVDGSTKGSGRGSDVTIETQRLVVQDGAQVVTGSDPGSTAPGGNLKVTAIESVELIGTSADGAYASGLTTSAQDAGDAGALTIATQKLILRDGAQVSTSTSGAGNAGELTVNATDIQIIGISPKFPSSLSTQVSEQATGTGGNLTIETGKLTLQNGGQVQVSTFGKGNGGSLNLTAGESIELMGFGTGADGKVLRSGLFSSTQGSSGNAGNLSITTGQLMVREGARVSAFALDSGYAGDIFITVRDNLQTNGGTIIAGATKTGGGNIKINASDIRLRNSSLLSTSVADSTGGGGNITINSGKFIALEDSDVLATAFKGSGGRITINAPVFLPDIFAAGGIGIVNGNTDVSKFAGNGRVDISASSQFGTSGTVNLPNFNLVQNALGAPSNRFIGSLQVRTISCLTNRNRQRGRFTVAGTDILPVTPYNDFDLWYALPVQPSSTRTQQKPLTLSPVATQSKPWKIGDRIVEAQGLVRTADGRIILSSTPQNATPESANLLVCHPDEDRAN